MNLEPVTQTAVSQKEKTKYHILTHTYVIQENRADELICRQRQKCRYRDLQTQWGENRESDAETHTVSDVKQADQELLYDTGAQTGAL